MVEKFRGGYRSEQYICCRMQGRDPEDPTNRKIRGKKLTQRLEPKEGEITNALTKVAKDNMILVRQASKSGYAECNIGGGGRFKLSRQQDEERTSDRERADNANDTGEFP